MYLLTKGIIPIQGYLEIFLFLFYFISIFFLYKIEILL